MKEPALHYGYLSVTVDMTTPRAETLTIVFQAPGAPTARDQVVVNLATNELSG